MNESEIIEGCRHNNNTARKALYETYFQQMMAICYRYTGDKLLSEDLLHDGFIKAFLSFNSFQYRGNGSLRAWLSRVFANTALEYLRKNNDLKMIGPLEEWKEYGEEIREEDTDRIPDHVLMRFVTELPAGYRTVFNMYTFEDMSHSEIGAVLGINESSSRSQLSRAKALLAKRVKDYVSKNER